MENTNHFGFGFNDENFSDKTLLIELIPDSDQEPYPVDGDAVPPKRRRFDSNDDGHETDQSNGSQSTVNNTAAQIKTIHISTIILAAKSPFFFKLFSNGMAESKQRYVTLRIWESEEVAFMDLLKFMYTNMLSSTTPSALLDVLMAADKYEVSSCMEHCFQLLHAFPMTLESAFYISNLPSTILKSDGLADTVQSLVDVANKFLVAHFNFISKVQKEEEMLSLPLAGIEAVLSRDDLQVDSEDEIYDFVMKWARRHYTELNERQEILNTHLLRLIRFQFMSCRKLKEFLECTDINLERSAELVFDALSFQIPHQQLAQPSQVQERAYRHRPVKVIRFNSPREECLVYLDLKREECACLYSSDGFRSQSFDLGGQACYLAGNCQLNARTGIHGFSFGLRMQMTGLLAVKCEFSWRMKESEDFVGKKKSEHRLDVRQAYGFSNLFGEPWATFIAEDSPYFINGVLHLRAVIEIMKEVEN